MQHLDDKSFLFNNALVCGKPLTPIPGEEHGIRPGLPCKGSKFPATYMRTNFECQNNPFVPHLRGNTVLRKSQMYNDDQKVTKKKGFLPPKLMNCYNKKSKINNALSYRIGIPNFLTSPNDYIMITRAIQLIAGFSIDF